MPSGFQAKGLDYWVSELDQTPLPVLAHSVQRSQSLMADADVSLHQIGALIEQDPVLTLLLLKECNRRFAGRVAGTLSNINHCLSMLGLDHVHNLLRELPADSPSQVNPGYLQALQDNLYCFKLIADWGQFRNLGQPTLLQQGVLLNGAPTWALWQISPRSMQIMHHLFTHHGVPWEEAQLAVLGCRIQELAAGLARRWQFDEALCQALDSAGTPPLGFLIRFARQVLHMARSRGHASVKLPNKASDGSLINTPQFTINLANGLIRECGQDWYSKQSLRLHAITAAYLDQPLEVIQDHHKQVALELSRQQPVPGTIIPACNLIRNGQSGRRRTLKPDQVIPAITRLWARNATDNAPSPAKPAKSHAQQAAAPQPPRIGIRSEQLPEELDHQSIRAAPKRSPPNTGKRQHAGFSALETRQAFEQLMKRLQRRDPGFSQEFDALRAVVDCLYGGTGMKRVVLAQLSPVGLRVQASYARGCEESPQLERFQVSLQPPNLFSQILKQPAATWVSRERQQQVAGIVPGQFKLACQSDEFFLMSLFTGQGPFGVMYADRGLNDRLGLTEAEYRIFKAAGHHCSLYLGYGA